MEKRIFGLSREHDVRFLYELGEKTTELVLLLRKFNEMLDAYQIGYLNLHHDAEEIKREAKKHLELLKSLFGYRGDVCQHDPDTAECKSCPVKKISACHGPSIENQHNAFMRFLRTFFSKNLKDGSVNDIWGYIDKLDKLLTAYDCMDSMDIKDFIKRLSEIIAELANKIDYEFLYGKLKWPSLKHANEKMNKKIDLINY